MVADLVERAFRRTGAELVLAAIFAITAVGLVVFLRGLDYLAPKHVLMALIPAFFGWITVHTWRRLWRKGQDRWGVLVFDYGVRRFGIWSWVAFAAIFPAVIAPNVYVALFFIVWALFTFPLWLWMGYGWGIIMAAIFKIERPSVHS